MYLHTTQAASLLEISPRRLRQLLQQGRVKGAYKTGKYWLIPLFDEVRHKSLKPSVEIQISLDIYLKS